MHFETIKDKYILDCLSWFCYFLYSWRFLQLFTLIQSLFRKVQVRSNIISMCLSENYIFLICNLDFTLCVILIFILDELDPNFREECRSKDEYTMVLTYFLGSSLLFCFTMSFLFSLCIVGSPLLRDVMNDKHAFRQRYGNPYDIRYA